MESNEYVLKDEMIDPETDVHCRWVDKTVKLKELSKHCRPFIGVFNTPDGSIRCDRCDISPQIAMGMPVDRLLTQLKSGD